MNKLIEKFETSQTSQFRIVFPDDLNDHATLFGGKAMEWMDEVAYVTALRFARKKMVTVSVDSINFLKPIKSGTIVEITGKIVKAGHVKININVEVYAEDVYIGNREKAIQAMFTFAAVNQENKPARLIDFYNT